MVFDLAGAVAQRNLLHSLKQLQEHIDAYVDAYNEKAEPFVWTKKKVRQRRFKGRRIHSALIPGTRLDAGGAAVWSPTREFSTHHAAQAEWNSEMITVPELVSHALGSFLTAETRDRFGSSHAGLTELLPFAAKLTLECIGNSDALYHNIEHTLLVTLAGHDILTGRALLRPTTANDYANFILACLTHDIGYVRGVVQGR